MVSEKDFELLKESRPGIKRVGVMFSPANVPSAKTAKAMQEKVGPRLGNGDPRGARRNASALCILLQKSVAVGEAGPGRPSQYR
jgi:hypothetical protein